MSVYIHSLSIGRTKLVRSASQPISKFEQDEVTLRMREKACMSRKVSATNVPALPEYWYVFTPENAWVRYSLCTAL